MAPTQDVLYADIDLALSWSERDLPERARTKHVHRLHPYLGKFIPQLVEILLARYFRPGPRPLCGFRDDARSGAREWAGRDRRGRRGLQLPADGRQDSCVQPIRARTGAARGAPTSRRAHRSAAVRVRSPLVRPGRCARAARVSKLGRRLRARRRPPRRAWRAARSARRTTHFDLDFPRAPQLEPYWCHKHRRECRPVETASQFLRRYTIDTLARLKEFARVRARGRAATVIHGDVREERLSRRYDGVLTSPPYPGLIDYHEQHRYAYELLGLDDRRELEVGAAAAGTSRAALAAYMDGIVDGLVNDKSSLRRGAVVVIVVNDRRDLYPEILERAGLRLEERLRRHVNRRTGRRAGEFFEDVLVARAG